MNKLKCILLLSGLLGVIPAHAAFSVIAQADGSSTTLASSMGTSATLNLASGDRVFIAVAYTHGGTADSVSVSDGGDTFVSDGDQVEGTYHLAFFEVKSAGVNSAATFTATDAAGAYIQGIGVIQIRGLSNVASSAFASAGIQGPGTTTDAITTGNITPASQPAAIIGFTWDAQNSGAPLAGTGFTGQTPIFSTVLAGGVALFETERLTSTSPVAATFTAQNASQFDYFIQGGWIVPESGGGGSCTHSGITSAGAIAVPNGTSGSYQGKSGAFVTPDCSTVNYKQPTIGNFGTN